MEKYLLLIVQNKLKIKYMAIPTNITRNHIIDVINQINNGRQIPKNRQSKGVTLRYNNAPYPVKLLISWGNEIANGQEFPSKAFVTQEAVRYLTALGFEIVNI